MTEFSVAVTAEQWKQILKLSARVRDEVASWSRPFSIIDPRRIAAVSSVAAATVGSFCELNQLAALAEIMLVIFALDDVIDEERYSPAELGRRLDRIRAIIDGGGAERGSHDEPLEAAFASLEQTIRAEPLYGELAGLWAGNWHALFESMVRESGWKYHKPLADLLPDELPTYNFYIENAQITIGGPTYIGGLLILIGDPSTSQHLPRLRQMEREMSIAIRLANDIRSSEKERKERKVNALVIIERDALGRGLGEVEAKQHALQVINERMRDALVRCVELQSLGRTSTGRPEEGIVATGKFSCGFYEQHDFHTFEERRPAPM